MGNATLWIEILCMSLLTQLPIRRRRCRLYSPKAVLTDMERGSRSVKTIRAHRYS